MRKIIYDDKQYFTFIIFHFSSSIRIPVAFIPSSNYELDSFSWSLMSTEYEMAKYSENSKFFKLNLNDRRLVREIHAKKTLQCRKKDDEGLSFENGAYSLCKMGWHEWRLRISVSYSLPFSWRRHPCRS